MAEEDALKVYWDHFFKAETGTYEKSTWLDLFLAEFLIRVNEGANPKELITFCPVSGVVSLVGCELLCGIHRVTSAVTAHCAPLPPAPPDAAAACSGKEPADNASVEAKGEEPRLPAPGAVPRGAAQASADALQQHLLRGSAWRALVLLKALGVEGLSCCRQLSSVLVWVWGELRGAPPPRAPPAPAPAPRAPIHLLFSHKIWSKQKQNGGQGSKTNSSASSEKGSATGRSRSSQMKQDSESKTKRKHTKHSEESSGSEDSNGDLQVLNRSLAVRVCSTNDDFNYFDSPMRSSNDYPNETLYSDPYHTPRKAKPKADDHMTDKHKEIINSEISTFEFTLLVIDLLQELCKTESSLSGSEGSQVSVQCINFTLRNLCSLQFGSLPLATQSNTEEVSTIKVALTELLIVSLDKVLIHSDLCAKLINNGILPMLLRILEDVICKSSSKYKDAQKSAKDIEKPNKTESDNLLKFIFGVAYCITAFFHCLLMQCRSVDRLRAFTDQFKLYGECLKGDLLKECIELMVRIPANEEDVVMLVKKLIESVGKLIIGMKRVRSEVIHSAACPRSRHKVCRQRVAAGMHHHHDILGEAGTGLPLASSCCISVLYGTLTSLVTDEEVSGQSLLRSKILRTMLNSGGCCCFSPGFLMESIVRLMLTHNSVATLCLQVLEHTVYGELGASVLMPKVTDQLPCSICEPCEDKRDLVRKYCPHGVSPVERKSVWSFLIHYNSLLQLDNHNNVLHATVSHLLRVTPKCRMEMKYELLFSVIYPTFIVAKHRYIIRMEEAAYFLTVSCLNIFASLLNTVSFAEQFIQKGGLSYVLELVSLSEFSNQCCSILEIAIIVEIFKLMKDNSDMTYYREMSSLESVQMLFKSLTEMTDKCSKIFNLKLPVDKFEELSDVTKERESLMFQQVPRGEVSRRLSAPRPIKTSYASSENVIEDSVEDYLEILKNAWTFWKSCAGLCLYSPMFRRYLVGELVFVDSYALLKLLLYYLCHCECGQPEMRTLVKIVEALLTVQFAVTDVTGGRSKETSCAVVRGALEGGAAVAGGAGAEGAGLRALCEALIRVCLAQPSRHHAMPAQHHAKVPPLGCESGASSAAGSSSEDSASGPYASEPSEPAHPDPGYEADIEIGKLELLSLQKSRKTSGLSTMNSIAGYSPVNDSIDLECAEYKKQGELAHPELCVIVVDVLTQLITKLVSMEGSARAAHGRRGAAALAGACCARLAGALGGALGGARAAPPLLLARLLAPAAAQLLTTCDHQLQELQRSILELVHVVASQGVTAGELGALLRLFAAEAPPLGALLAALLRLVRAAPPATPDCILSFPLDADLADVTPDEDESYVVVPSATSQSAAAEGAARAVSRAHRRAGIVSPWSAGAVRAGAEAAGWAAWLRGFALLLWLRHEPLEPPNKWESESQESEATPPPPKKEAPTKSTELYHVMSIGHESLMLELWLETSSGSLVLRLSRPEAGGYRALSEARVCGALPAARWSCLALNVQERVLKRRIHIQVTPFVNGLELETVSLPLQGILVRKVLPTLVVLGHAARGGRAGGGYHLSHSHVYRAPLLTVYTALHLTAHGPDHSCQIRCEGPNFPSVLTPEVLDCDLDWDQVYEISSTTLRELHDNLLLSFSAHAPNIMNLYHQTVSLPTVFAGRVAAGGGAAGGGAAGGPPEALALRWAARAAAHRGVAPALLLLGGPDVLLYLFARVVELEGSGEQQASALGVLLRACAGDARLHAALHAAARLRTLHTVLAAAKCRVSHHMLKVILDEACSAPILSESGGTLVLDARTAAVVLEPRLLLLLVRAWRQLSAAQSERCCQEVSWEEEAAGGRGAGRGSLWALWLRCLTLLLRDSHPRQAFNHDQLARARMLPALLEACKERFLNSECGPLPAGASGSLVAAARGLLGAPPPLHRVALLCDFLLLMHQASDTFVTHSRANFYFLLTSETPESSQLQSTKRRSSRKTRKKDSDVTEPSSSSVTSEDMINDNSINISKEEAQKEDDKMGSSVESTKQLKGLINMQIKEGRTHKISSTSENSDPNIERSAERDSGLDHTGGEGVEGAGAGEGPREASPRSEGDERDDREQTLNDFIVVDVDDVTHATVQMYSSGIYHQSSVRAGAEPGWAACEGLLLLLRDVIAALPAPALAQAVGGVIQAETLVVLANHRCGRVRAAAVRALAALARRAPPDLARRLRAQHHYLHLANQITLYPVTWDLAAACAALLTKCDVPLEDQLDDDVWLDLPEEAALRGPPLLALLPACVRDVPLAHNISLIVRRLIDKASLKILSEVSVAEVVVRAIRGVGELGEEEWEGRALLLESLHALLIQLAIKAAAAPHGMQTVCELHHMLTHVEGAGARRGQAGVRRAARGAQLALFAAQLDYLEDRLHSSYSAHTKYSNYFTTVLSSAVSLGAEGSLRGERAELAARHGAVLQRAAGFLLTHPPDESAEREAPLRDRLLAALLPGAGGQGAPRRWWAGGAEAEPALVELFWWSLAPSRAARPLQPALLRLLYRAPPALLAPTDPPTMRKLAVYLVSMLKHVHLLAEAGAAGVELSITDWARGVALGTQAALPERLPSDALRPEAERLLRADRAAWAQRAARLRPHVHRTIFGKEALAAKVTEGAMWMTRQVVDVQNGQRKEFMEQLRRAHSELAAHAQRWQRLVAALTHERALWHCARGYPQAWQLDATEGPGRVRVRLRRAHLNVQPRFLKPEHRHKLESLEAGAPLHSVVGGGGGGGGAGLRGGLVARLQLHETVSYTARVTYVSVASETPGELLLSDRCIHFVPEDSEQPPSKEHLSEQSGAQSWPLEGVVCVSTRRWCLQERAAELFLASGHAHLLAFSHRADRAAFLRALNDCPLPARTEPDTLTEAMTQWRNGQITNWEYLMRLNGLAGRTYNDLMQYPVLPFILADYTSRILDLNDPKSFRDLTKPMAIQNKNREQHYINTYNDLKAARREGCSPLLSRQPHHYASLYSNSGGVLHYLVRLPPFTQLFLHYQDNNFDMPDRTFHSLATTWRLITNDSPTDVKELIPELFYLPELFHNNEGLNLGVRQCGAGVDDVELAPWAAGDARLFTLLHRHALEAALVTDRLPHWLDLVFGYKQTGQPAVDAVNVFPACTYYGFDPSTLEDEVDRAAAAAMVRTYGQAPRQLLTAPHPHRAPDLRAPAPAQPSVWAGVEGAHWGRYCGSPALPPPAVTARRACAAPAALQPLPGARAAAAPHALSALHALAGPVEAAGAGAGAGAGPALALVSWGHSDNVVRLKRGRDARHDLLLQVPALDQITKVTTSCITSGTPSPMFIGHASGRIVSCSLRQEAAALPPRALARALHAHSAAITDLHASARAGLLASASADGTIVLWDLNSLSYIRTLPNRDMLAVSLVTISDTLCDVASVHAPPAARAGGGGGGGAAAGGEDSDSYEKDDTYKYKSLLRVHTVNARFVGSVKVSDLVTSICYSAAPEGISVNCVACGLDSGSVRLYSSWDLRHVATVPPAHRALPLLSLRYSSDSSVLFGWYADGLAVAWESGAGARPAPRLLPASALF